MKIEARIRFYALNSSPWVAQFSFREHLEQEASNYALPADSAKGMHFRRFLWNKERDDGSQYSSRKQV